MLLLTQTHTPAPSGRQNYSSIEAVDKRILCVTQCHACVLVVRTRWGVGPQHIYYPEPITWVLH
jgi:hypothetical protein